jgi:hypothetical protein
MAFSLTKAREAAERLQRTTRRGGSYWHTPEGQDILTFIVEQRSYDRREALTYQQIADALNDLGAKTAMGREWNVPAVVTAYNYAKMNNMELEPKPRKARK